MGLGEDLTQVRSMRSYGKTTKNKEMEGDFTLKLLVIEQKESGGSIGNYVTIGWAREKAQIWSFLSAHAQNDLEVGEHQMLIESKEDDRTDATQYRVIIQRNHLGKNIVVSKIEHVANWLVRIPKKINLEEVA